MGMAFLIGPGVFGIAMLWFANKCRGKNAKDFFTRCGWGFLLLYLWFLAPFLPIFWPLSIIIALAPSALCFFLGVTSIIREMRSQKNGEFTEAA